jgi:hypothetical protein
LESWFEGSEVVTVFISRKSSNGRILGGAVRTFWKDRRCPGGRSLAGYRRDSGGPHTANTLNFTWFLVERGTWLARERLIKLCRKNNKRKKMDYDTVMIVGLFLIMVVGLQIQIRNINKRLDKLDGGKDEKCGK